MKNANDSYDDQDGLERRLTHEQPEIAAIVKEAVAELGSPRPVDESLAIKKTIRERADNLSPSARTTARWLTRFTLDSKLLPIKRVSGKSE